jgi:hypothetical protein
VQKTQTDTSTITLLGVSDPIQRRTEHLERRGTVIPTYASYCSGNVRYSSACSCIGVTSGTTTTTVTSYGATTTTTAIVASLKTVTTSTTTTTTSTTTTYVSALPTFYLQAQDTGVQGNDGLYARFVGGVDSDGTYGYVTFDHTTRGGSAEFSLDAQGHLLYNGSYADQDRNGVGQPNYNGNAVYFDPLIDLEQANDVLLVCDIASDYLRCDSLGNGVFQDCGGRMYLNTKLEVTQYCGPLSMLVIMAD